jgi:FkbM family methyltransferase
VKLSRFFLILAVLMILAGAGYAFYPPFKLLALYASGRSPSCSFSEALKADVNLDRQIEFKDKILNASHLVENDPKGYHLWETPKGRFWIPAGSDYVLPFNLAEQERKIYGVGNNGPHSGDVVLDCGANVGVTIREALDAGARKIIGIEPGPENLECLRRNFPREIAAGTVILVPKGVWDKEDFLTLRVDPSNSAADTFVLQREGSVDVLKVPLTTIDLLVSELKLDRVDYIKMDIEGSEPKALEGAQETLKKFKPRMSITTYHAPDHPKLIPEIIKRGRPDYQVECGPCSEAANGIRPDVLYFR